LVKADGSVIVLADAHLGLRRKFMNSVDCEPIHLQQLMDWLTELKDNRKIERTTNPASF
jgi:hypothetical protein